MARIIDVAKFNPTAGGTTDWTLSSAVTGYQTPALAGAVDGVPYHVRSESADLSQWEISVGNCSGSGTVFARTTVLYNSSGTGTGPGQTGAGTKINFSTVPVVGIVMLSEDVRERLETGGRILFVGASLGAPTISIATPAVVSLTAHGLSANDKVVFNVPRNTTACTISTASPAVVTMANTFAAGQPVQFHSTKYLPNGITKGTVYYVIAAGLSGASFQVSTTPGGAAVNTTSPTATFTNGSSTITLGVAHNLVVGQIIQFAGTSVVNFSNATDYYVVSTPLSTTITVSATPTGAAIVAGAVTTNGTLVGVGSHYCSTVGALPTGITEGTTYFVIAAGLTANAFEVSTSLAGAAVNTSGTVTGTPIYNVWTGSDSNNGLAATRAGALFTINAAFALVQTYDIGNTSASVVVCKGVHSDGVSINGPFLLGTGFVQLTGDFATPSNAVISPPSGTHCIQINHPGIILNVGGLRLVGNGGFGSGLNSFAGRFYINGAMDFGPMAGGGSHILTSGVGAALNMQAAYIVTGGTSGGGSAHCGSNYLSQISIGVAGSFLDVPSFVYFALGAGNGVTTTAVSHAGSATCQQWLAQNGGGVDTQGTSAGVLGNTAGVTTSPGWKT